MDNTYPDLERMDQYYSGTLEGDDLVLFEDRLKNDPDFAHEYELFLASVRAAAVEGRERDRKKIRDLLDKADDEDKGFRSRGVWPWLLAASLLILVGSAFVFRTSGNTDPADLYEAYNEPYPDYFNTMSVNGSHTLVRLGSEAYGQGDWQGTVGYYTQVPDTFDRFNLVQIYLGYAYTELDSFSQAGDCFRFVIDAGDESLEETAWWFLGMCKLKEGKGDEALRSLERAARLSPAKRKDFEEIREALE